MRAAVRLAVACAAVALGCAIPAASADPVPLAREEMCAINGGAKAPIPGKTCKMGVGRCLFQVQCTPSTAVDTVPQDCQNCECEDKAGAACVRDKASVFCGWHRTWTTLNCALGGGKVDETTWIYMPACG